MPEHRPVQADPVRLFFLIGPLRTGSSLLARCIDDHPDAICLCESEINRALFPPYAIAHHVSRMHKHGLQGHPLMKLLDYRRQDNVRHWLGWYSDVLPLLRERYGKPNVRLLGDKSPDFFASPALVEAIAGSAPLIYTVRDPRAILRSIWKQADATPNEKRERWEFLKANIRCWRPHWDRPNLLSVRFEDLVREPVATMARVYDHLGLAPSTRFLEPFPRHDHQRFLWNTAVDWDSGGAGEFDPSRAEVRNDDLTGEQHCWVTGDPDIAGFIERFGYAR
jgi:hypothetical protein